MLKALEVARDGLSAGEVPVGCLFVLENKIIAKSHNLTVKTKNATTHCEVNCIREITANGREDDLKRATLYVTVEPCIMCAHALALGGVTKVIYGCDNDKFGGNGSILSLHNFPSVNTYKVTRGVLADEAI